MTRKEISEFLEKMKDLNVARDEAQRIELMRKAGIDPRIFEGRSRKEVYDEIRQGLEAKNYEDLTNPISKQVFLRSQGVDANGIPLYYGGGLIDNRFGPQSSDAETRYKTAMANNDWLYTPDESEAVDNPTEEKTEGTPAVTQQVPSYDLNGDGVINDSDIVGFGMDQKEYDDYMDNLSQQNAQALQEQQAKQGQYENTKGAAQMMARFLNGVGVFNDAKGRISALRQQENSLIKPQEVYSAPNAGLQDLAYDAGAMQGQGMGVTANASLGQTMLNEYANEDQRRRVASGGQAGIYGIPQTNFDNALKIANANAGAETTNLQMAQAAQGAYGADLLRRRQEDLQENKTRRGEYFDHKGKIKSAEAQARHNLALGQGLINESMANIIPEAAYMGGINRPNVDWNTLRYRIFGPRKSTKVTDNPLLNDAGMPNDIPQSPVYPWMTDRVPPLQTQYPSVGGFEDDIFIKR